MKLKILTLFVFLSFPLFSQVILVTDSTRNFMIEDYRRNKNPNILDPAIISLWYKIPKKGKKANNNCDIILNENLSKSISFLNELSNDIEFGAKREVIISKIIISCYKGNLPLITLDGIKPDLIENSECRELFLKKYAQQQKDLHYIRNNEKLLNIYTRSINYLVDIISITKKLSFEESYELISPIIEANLDNNEKKVIFKERYKVAFNQIHEASLKK